MKYYALLTSGDKVALSEKEFEGTKARTQRGIYKNIPLENGGVIIASAIVFLGVSEPTKKAKESINKAK